MSSNEAIKRVRLDYPLMICVALLVGLGLTMVYSASAVLAMEKYHDSYYFIKRMLIFALLGFGALSFGLHFPFERWRKMVYPLLIVGTVLMLAVKFSPLGLSVGGARRWLSLGGLFRFQPSELMKFATILFLAYSLEKKPFEKIRKFTVGVVPHLMVGGVVLGMVLLQRDLGTATIIALLVAAMLFSSGARLFHLACLAFASLPALYLLVAHESYRLRRIFAFMNPWEDRLGSGFQIIQSYLAFSEGGLLGKGLGAGQQKLFYLPEAHTDFIFSVLGEELGLLGVIVTIGFFAFFCFRGFRIASMAPSLFGRYFAQGITLLIGMQAILNMAVVMGLLPTKGLVLPFVSYGGSSLLLNLLAVGVLLNISTYQKLYMAPVGGPNNENFARVRGNRGAPLPGNGPGGSV